MKNREIIAKNTKDTEKIAKTFLKYLVLSEPTKDKQASVVGLYGNLGAGKTTFAQSLGILLGIKRKINSPTFVIMKRYPIGKTLGADKWKNMFHIDAYRLKNEKELLQLGWEEIVSRPDNLVFIEWPENVKKIMPKKHHKIIISHLNNKETNSQKESRKFSLKML